MRVVLVWCSAAMLALAPVGAAQAQSDVYVGLTSGIAISANGDGTFALDYYLDVFTDPDQLQQFIDGALTEEILGGLAEEALAAAGTTDLTYEVHEVFVGDDENFASRTVQFSTASYDEINALLDVVGGDNIPDVGIARWAGSQTGFQLYGVLAPLDVARGQAGQADGYDLSPSVRVDLHVEGELGDHDGTADDDDSVYWIAEEGQRTFEAQFEVAGAAAPAAAQGEPAAAAPEEPEPAANAGMPLSVLTRIYSPYRDSGWRVDVELRLAAQGEPIPDVLDEAFSESALETMAEDAARAADVSVDPFASTLEDADFLRTVIFEDLTVSELEALLPHVMGELVDDVVASGDTQRAIVAGTLAPVASAEVVMAPLPAGVVVASHTVRVVAQSGNRITDHDGEEVALGGAVTWGAGDDPVDFRFEMALGQPPGEGLPGWVLPAAIGGGVLILVVIVLLVVRSRRGRKAPPSDGAPPVPADARQPGEAPAPPAYAPAPPAYAPAPPAYAPAPPVYAPAPPVYAPAPPAYAPAPPVYAPAPPAYAPSGYATASPGDAPAPGYGAPQPVATATPRDDVDGLMPPGWSPTA